MDVFSMLRGCRQAPVPHLARHVLMCVIVRANQKGQMWASLETLAADTSMSRISVKRSVKLILAAGLMRAVGKRGQVTAYMLDGIKLSELAAADVEYTRLRREAFQEFSGSNRSGGGLSQIPLGDLIDPPSGSDRSTNGISQIPNPPLKEPLRDPTTTSGPPSVVVVASHLFHAWGIGKTKAEEIGYEMTADEARRVIKWCQDRQYGPAFVIHAVSEGIRPWDAPDVMERPISNRSDPDRFDRLGII